MPFPEWLRAAGTGVGMSALPVLELKASIPVGLAGAAAVETFFDSGDRFSGRSGAVHSSSAASILPLVQRTARFSTALRKKLKDVFAKKRAACGSILLVDCFCLLRFHCRNGRLTGSALLPCLDIRIAHALPVICGNCGGIADAVAGSDCDSVKYALNRK